MEPVVKWAGGKRQLLPEIKPIIRSQQYETFVEPFLGGGAVLLSLMPEKAIVNDCNEELMNLYKQIMENPDELISKLEEHKKKNDSGYYYAIRQQDRTEEYQHMSDCERAARMLYLNKTCYNGLYRVNSHGYFNSPYGKYANPDIVSRDRILELSSYLNANDVTLECGDYKKILENVPDDAFVYIDPPYLPTSESSNFTGYTSGGFGYAEHVQLKELCESLRDRGVPFLQSNSDCAEVRELYRDFEIIAVEACRCINSVGSRRGSVGEVLIRYSGQ